MRILLLSAPYLPEYMRNARCDFVSLSASQWYPILLGQAGAYLEGNGHEVKLIDAPAHYLNHQQTRQLIRDYRPGLLVLYTGYQSEANDIAFADPLVDEIGCDAVMVGPYASIDPKGSLSRTRVIDKLIVGEFDHPLGELAARRPSGDIKNLVYKEDNRIVRNPNRRLLSAADLDDIPFVSRFFRRQLDIRRYKTPSEPYPFMDIMTGRGCAWGHCTYCLWVHTYITGKNYTTRSIHNVIEELRYIAREISEVRSVMIQDDTFTAERAGEFSEAKLSAGIRLPWSCYARGDMSPEVLSLMKRAGCLNLHVGYESAVPGVLKRIKKGLTVEGMSRFTEDAKHAGLHIHGDFAIGFPGETPREAQMTIDWACRLRPHTAQFQLMIPFPGTPYHTEMQKNGWLNAQGQPDMPQFSNQQIRHMAKRAYRSFYFSRAYFMSCCRHPVARVFSRAKTISRAIPAMFWRKWQV